MPGSPQWTLSFRFPHQNPVHASPFPHSSYMPRPSHSSRFYHPHSSWWGIQIIKLLIMKCSKLPCPGNVGLVVIYLLHDGQIPKEEDCNCVLHTIVTTLWYWIVSLYSINWLGSVTKTGCVYCAVRTGSLHIIQVKLTWSISGIILTGEADVLGEKPAPVPLCPPQISYGPSPRRPDFDPRPVHMRLVVDNVALERYFLQVFRFSPVSIIPPMLHTNLHLHVAPIGRTNVRSLGTFQKTVPFQKSRRTG
jgi:hypothetical protein